MEGGGFLIFLVAMFAIMYFLLIRPQRAKQRAAQEMLSRLAPGDEIVTVGGIYGDVVEVYDDKVVVEIAEDVHIEVARRAIAQIVPPEPELGEPEASRDGEPPEAEEPAVAQPPAPAREERRFRAFGRRSG